MKESPDNGSSLPDQIRRLREADNRTNWRYLAVPWLVIAICVGMVVTVHQWQLTCGASVWWNLPAVLLAIVAIGASQHQLGGAAHEATHYILFRNRLLNELASDWLCMFAMFGTTHLFRSMHLDHHQFVNDPERDPDHAMLRMSGHWLKFPVSRQHFLGMLLRQALLYPLIKYTMARAYFSAVHTAYQSGKSNTAQCSPWPRRIATLYLMVVPAVIVIASLQANPQLVVITLLSGVIGIAIAAALIPATQFPGTVRKPTISNRATWASRLVHLTLTFAVLAWVRLATGVPTWGYAVLLWLVPLVTTFPLFMILRQVVQHGNGDQGRMTNTRVFLVNPLLRYAIFPFGMDYHLPHHMYANVPHYRLRDLHKALLADADYASDGLIVEGYWSTPDRTRPSILDVVGPEYARNTGEVFVDESVSVQALEGPRRAA